MALPDSPEVYYMTPDHLDLVDDIKASEQLHLLSPFDNLVIQRKRLSNLFDFDYLIECYVPEKKRVFGYYTIPILWGEALWADLTPKWIGRAKPFISRTYGWKKVSNQVILF